MNIPSPFTAVDTNFNSTTEMALKLNSVAGYAVLTYGPNFPGPGSGSNLTATGLANDATAYTATVTVNGTPHAVSVTGSTAQTFADLITEINTDISTWATAALVGDSIVITVTDPVPGPTSIITVADTGATPLFASVKGSTFGLVNNKSVKGGDNYVVWNQLDSVTQANVTYTVDSFLAAATANTNQPWTSGSDTISFPTGSPAPGTDTGLTLSTVYQLNVNVDGAGGVEVLINLPILETQGVVSFNHLLEAFNIALQAQSVPAVATFDSNSLLTLRVTSNSVGASSTVVVTDGAVNGLLAALAAFGPANSPAGTSGYQTVAFTVAKAGGDATGLTNDVPATSGYQVVNVGGAVAGGDATGLTNDATVYTASISVDGTPIAISVTGSTAQTYTTLINEINTDLGVAAVAAIVGGNIRVTSASTGASSTVAITDTDLFSTLTAYVAILAAVPGADTVVTTYTASISVDGVAKPISVGGGTAQTFTTLLSEINTDLGASAVAAIVGGNIRVTSATSGLTSTVAITDTNLFSSLTNYSAIQTAVAGTSAAGVNGSTDVTFPVTKASETWTNWNDVVLGWPSLTGTQFGPLFTSGGSAHIKKENKPAAKGEAFRTAVYYNGTNWVYYDTDVAVGGTGTTVAPPEL